MMHKCILVTVRGEAKKPKLNENRGKFINFAEIGVEIYKFCVNKGEYAICIIGLGNGRMDAPGF